MAYNTLVKLVQRVMRSPYVVGTALALVALLYRLLLARTSLATVDSDQAVLGIMARHILHGDRPVFFYGQSYQGALEAYLTAAIFALWGQSDLLLRLAPSLVSALLVAQLYVLGRRLYGPRVGVVTGLWLALPAPVLAYWGTAAGAGYAEVMALGTGLFLIATRRWGLGQPRRYDLPALGLLAGAGVWVHPVIVYYLAALALAYVPLLWRLHGLSSLPNPLSIKGRRRGIEGEGVRAALQALAPLTQRAWPVAACFVLGAAPWLLYTLRHGGATLAVPAGRGAVVPLADALGRLGSETLPLLLGGGLPDTDAGRFAGYVNDHDLPYALALLALCYLVARLFISPGGIVPQARVLLAGRPLADAPLALLLPVVLVVYLLSPFEALSWTTHNPRYLLPLYTATPYLIACALPCSTRALRRRRPWRRWLQALPLRRLSWHDRQRRASPFLAGVMHARPIAVSLGPPASRRPHAMAAKTPAHAIDVPAWLRAARLLYADGARALARPAVGLVVGVALALNVYGSAHYETPSRVTSLAAALVARGDGAVYCYYWLAWRLAFESKERLIPVVTWGLQVDAHPGGNRYPPYLARARDVRRWAYILPYDVDAPALDALLRRKHVAYSRWRWGDASVFDGPVSRDFPPILPASAEPSTATTLAAAVAAH